MRWLRSRGFFCVRGGDSGWVSDPWQGVTDDVRRAHSSVGATGCKCGSYDACRRNAQGKKETWPSGVDPVSPWRVSPLISSCPSLVHHTCAPAQTTHTRHADHAPRAAPCAHARPCAPRQSAWCAAWSQRKSTTRSGSGQRGSRCGFVAPPPIPDVSMLWRRQWCTG